MRFQRKPFNQSQTLRRRSAQRLSDRARRRLRIESLEARRLLAAQLDFGDAPDLGPGTGPGDYQTLPSDNGPSHVVSPSLYLGGPVDGQLETTAGLRNPSMDLNFTVTSSPAVSVFATNETGKPAVLHGWVDFNGDGLFDNATEYASAEVGFSSNEAVRLQFSEVITGFTGETYSRFRIGLKPEPGDIDPAGFSFGAAGIGEVEDYVANVTVPSAGRAETLQFFRADPTEDEVFSAIPFVGLNYRFGESVASIGDLDGNGTTDLAVAVPGDNSKGPETGAIHLFFMEPDGSYSKRKIIPLGGSGFVGLTDGSGQHLRITSLGDLDGDSVPDLAVSSRASVDGSVSVYALFLNSDGTAKASSLIAVGAGYPLAHLGDLDNDGTQELAVKRPFSGNEDHFQILSLDSDGAVQRTTEIYNDVAGNLAPDENDWFGSAATKLGDLDGDGVSELAVGVRQGGNDDEGAVQILFMDASLNVKSRTRVSSDFYTFSAPHNSDFGGSLAAIGDLDGDGITELVVGDPSQRALSFPDREPLNDVDGAAYLLFLNNDGTLKSATRSIKASARTPDEEYASSVTILGDLSGDGTVEIAIGAPGFFRTGAVDIVSLDSAGVPTNSKMIGPFGTEGQDTRAVASIGDVDGNGFDDLAVFGAPVLYEGSDIEVLFMGPQGRVITTTPIDVPMFGASFGEIGSLASAGDLDGDGIEELAVGIKSLGIPQESPLANGLTSILFLNADGSLRDTSEIFPSPNIGPDDDNVDPAYLEFGRAITSVGDLDGNGVHDLAVSQDGYSRWIPFPDGSGASSQNFDPKVQILFMNGDGSVLRRETIAALDPTSLATVGDLDGDGLSEIVAGSPDVIEVLFLNSEGELRDRTTYTYEDPWLDTESELFGMAATSIGDLDGDGVADLLIGAPGRSGDNCQPRHGGIHALLLNGNGNGTVKEHQNIDIEASNLNANIGVSLASLGDIDQDGSVDFVSAAPPRCGAPDGGLIVFEMDKKRFGDVGDAPDVGVGTEMFNYQTLRTDDGPVHTIDPRIFLGQIVSDDLLVNSSNNADGDDDDGVVDADRDLRFTGGQSPLVELTVTNTTGQVAYLTGWIDTNLNGLFEPFESSTLTIGDEQVEQESVALQFPHISAGFAAQTYARFRITTDEAALVPTGIAGETAVLPTGIAMDGEVEDYRVMIESSDVLAVARIEDLGLSSNPGRSAKLAKIGDVNGDDFEDYAVPGQIIFADAAGQNLSTRTLDGSAGAVTGIGDINGDGVPDVASYAGTSTTYPKGAVRLLMLDPNGNTIESVDIAEGVNGGPMHDGYRPKFGSAVLGIGDLNLDGYSDLIATDSNNNELYVLFLDADHTVKSYVRHEGPDQGGFGNTIVNLGDINDDGVIDLLIGARHLRDNDARMNSVGAVYIALMKTDGTFDRLTRIDERDMGVAVNQNDYFGYSATALGDIDGDDITDIAVGAHGSDLGANEAGAVFVITLNSDGSAKQSTVVRTGAVPYENYGLALFAIPDRDDNGLPEIAIGTSELHYLSQEVFDFGDAPTRAYQTDVDPILDGSPDTGGDVPSHGLTAELFLGAGVDGEHHQRSNDDASLDDFSGVLNDDDGLIDRGQLSSFVAGQSTLVDVRATNTTGREATLWGWIDFNGNNVFDGEERAMVSVPDKSIGEIFTVKFPAVSSTPDETTYARFRLSTDSAGSHPTGPAVDGEVEDYSTAITLIDSLAINNVTDRQGAVGETDFVFTVTRSGSLIGTVTFDFATSDATATLSDDDYLQTSGTLTFLDGESTKTITVPVNGDTKEEADETFTVSISAVTGPAVIARGQGTGTILSSNGFVIHGISAADNSGWSVSGAGDVNNDGFEDLVVGAFDADRIGTFNVGESYVVFGGESFPAELNLSSLDGTNGFVIRGVNPDDWSGYSVSGAGDVNNDGFDDLIIGAPYADPSGISKAGESYVVFGGETFPANLNLSSLDGANGFVIRGINPDDWSGYSVSGAGDVNNDGFGDLIVSAMNAAPDGTTSAGESYVVFGGESFPADFNLSSLDGTNGFVIRGINPGDRFGYSVSGAVDVNNDGFEDLIIGARSADPGGTTSAGESYVVFGGESFPVNLNLSSLDGTNGFVIRGINLADESGTSVSGAGDLNNDGYEDLIIGAPNADPSGMTNAGESYVVFGGESFPADVSLSSLDGNKGFVIRGVNPDDNSGWSVSGAGDVNNDGFEDLIIGAPRADPGGISRAGESYVVFGGESFSSYLNLSSLNGTNGFVIRGINPGDQSGQSVSGADDVNNDGFDDLIIGVPYANPSGKPFAGESYVVFGRPTFAAAMDLANLVPSVENWVDEAVTEQEPTLVIETDTDNLGSMIDAIEGLNDLDVSSGEALEIVLVLATGDYPGETINLPAGIKVKLIGSDGTELTGASPALTVEAGNVVVENITFTNATDAPTIQLLAGTLTVRNSTIEETTTGDRPAVEVQGGSLSLGTTDAPGGNTIIIHGAGDLIHSSGPNPIAAIGNSYQVDDLPLTNGFDIQQQIVDTSGGSGGSGGGLVSIVVDEVFLSTVEGTTDVDLMTLVADLQASDPVFAITAGDGGSATLLTDDQTVRFDAPDDGTGSFTYTVAQDDTTIATRTVHFQIDNVAPIVDLGPGLTVDEGGDVSFADKFTDPGSGDTHTFLWQVASDNGQIVSDSTERDFSFTSADDGTYTVTYTVTDDDGATDSDTVVITAANRNPNAITDTPSVDENSAVIAIDVLANDTDPAGVNDPLAITGIDASSTLGSVTHDQGVIQYDPNGQFESLAIGESAIETFTYSISDGDGGTAVGTVTLTVRGENDAPVATLGGSVDNETDDQDQLFDWDVTDIDGGLDTVQIVVEKDGQRIESLSGPVDASGRVDFNGQGIGDFDLILTAVDVHGAVTTATRTVTVADDDLGAPQLAIEGSSGTELEIDTNQFSWNASDSSGLSALAVTVTQDTGDGPMAVFSSTDLADASGVFNFDDLGVGIFEILVVATDGDDDWAGDGAGATAGRTAVVGELYISTSTRAKLNIDDDQWVTLHRSNMTSTTSGDVLFDHSQLSHPWFSWWAPNLDAFHMLADGSMILSTDGRASIGDESFRDGGLVRFFGDEWLARNADNPGDLHQTAQMIASEAQLFGQRSWKSGIDAISIAPDGDLVISLDTLRQLADGMSYHPGDLVKIRLYDNGDLAESSLYFDHNVLNATGWHFFGHRWSDRGVNVNGAHVLEDGRIVLTVTRTATAGDGDATFEDGDIFVYDPNDDVAEMLFDEDNFRRNEDVDAVFLGLGNGELQLLDHS